MIKSSVLDLIELFASIGAFIELLITGDPLWGIMGVLWLILTELRKDNAQI